MRRTFIPIQTPCNVEFSNLRAAGKHRFCDDCKKVVHDLSALSESEARAVLAGERRDLCVRYLYDANGDIHFGDSPLIAASSLVRQATAAITRNGKVAAVVLAAPLLFQACGGAGADPGPVALSAAPFSTTDTMTGAASAVATPSAPAVLAPLPSAAAVDVDGSDDTQDSNGANGRVGVGEADAGSVDAGPAVFE